MNSRSATINALSALQDIAENHNTMLSTVERLIEVTNKDGEFPEGSIEFIRYNEQIDLINRLHSILASKV